MTGGSWWCHRDPRGIGGGCRDFSAKPRLCSPATSVRQPTVTKEFYHKHDPAKATKESIDTILQKNSKDKYRKGWKGLLVGYRHQMFTVITWHVVSVLSISVVQLRMLKSLRLWWISPQAWQLLQDFPNMVRLLKKKYGEAWVMLWARQQ